MMETETEGGGVLSVKDRLKKLNLQSGGSNIGLPPPGAKNGFSHHNAFNATKNATSNVDNKPPVSNKPKVAGKPAIKSPFLQNEQDAKQLTETLKHGRATLKQRPKPEEKTPEKETTITEEKPIEKPAVVARTPPKLPVDKPLPVPRAVPSEPPKRKPLPPPSGSPTKPLPQTPVKSLPESPAEPAPPPRVGRDTSEEKEYLTFKGKKFVKIKLPAQEGEPPPKPRTRPRNLNLSKWTSKAKASVKRNLPSPPQEPEEVYDDIGNSPAAGGEEVYDDCGMGTKADEGEIYDDAQAPMEEIYDDAEAPSMGEIYDDAEAPSVKRALPSPPKQEAKRSLPSVPPADDGEELYDDTEAAPVLRQKSTTRPPPPPTPAPEEQEVYDDCDPSQKQNRVSIIPTYDDEIEEETYDDVKPASSPDGPEEEYQDVDTPASPGDGYNEEVYEDFDELERSAPQGKDPKELEKERKQQEKLAKEQQKKEEKERKKKEKEEKQKQEAKKKMCEKFKVTGDETALKICSALSDAKGGKYDLMVKKGDQLEVIREADAQPNKWLVRNAEGIYGFLEKTIIDPPEEQGMENGDLDEAIYEEVGGGGS